MTSTSDIRRQFLTYFQSQGHEIVSSSSLVPAGDATLLFTNAGMVQFKDCFLGQEKRAYTRATTSQRCVRAGGKHNDLENVGYTARHHTFFEMLGNFSFGDYFKIEAIDFAWNFLTEVAKLPKDKLWVTVFEEDDEAYDIWAKRIGVPEERIARIGAKDNFWQMGDTGPCGPCTEIFYDHGPDVWGGPPGTPEEDGDRYIEIWNIVFMQYDRSADGTLTPLPKPSVDTGMGLERIAAVLQGVHSNYEIDLFQNLLAATSEIMGLKERDNNSLRVIADHIRSCSFLIVDGVLPSNEGRGYVLRRIIRRAARHGHKLGVSEPFFHKLVAPLVAEMGEAYPELSEGQAQVEKVLKLEEQRFSETLEQGMKILEEAITSLKDKTIPGDVLFKLYDTYGFPLDLTADIARERELEVDEAGFEVCMAEQRERARSANQFGVDLSTRITIEDDTLFSGYDHVESSAEVLAIYSQDGDAVTQVSEGAQATVVLSVTPFYGESGGQVGDTGVFISDSSQFTVQDTQKQSDTMVHIGVVEKGQLSKGDHVTASIDVARRRAIVANHSATHLLHAALREVLGTHVQQKGSLVAPNTLRFDFSHFEPVSAEQLLAVEQWVNAQIRENGGSLVREMDMESAKSEGATALFGEKYGDVVRVVSIGAESTELCGGTHVNQTGDIGLFRITSEGGIAAGVRRIEAVTAQDAFDFTISESTQLSQIVDTTRAKRSEVVERVTQLVEKNRQLERELDKLKAKLASQSGDQLLSDAVEIEGAKVLAVKLEGVDAKSLRDTADEMKHKLGSAIVVLGLVDEGKVKLVAGVTKELTKRVKAGELVNFVANQVGGKGGGRPDMAMAGGDQPDQLDSALASVTEWVRKQFA